MFSCSGEELKLELLFDAIKSGHKVSSSANPSPYGPRIMKVVKLVALLRRRRNGLNIAARPSCASPGESLKFGLSRSFSTNNRRISSSLSSLPRPFGLAADFSLEIMFSRAIFA